MLAVFIKRDDLHGDVTRRRILLQITEHRPTQHVGQENVKRDSGGPELARQGQGIGAAHGHEDFESVVSGEIDQNPGVVRVVFYDQQHRITFL